MPRRVVLIHGGGTTRRFWDRLLPLLPGDALAVDLPGRPVPLQLQTTMLERLPNDIDVVDLDSGHIPAVTRPGALAAVICAS